MPLLRLLLITSSLLTYSVSFACQPTVEFSRVDSVMQKQPQWLAATAKFWPEIEAALTDCQTPQNCQARASKIGQQLWSYHRSRVQAGKLDDRALYWQRLALLRQIQAKFTKHSQRSQFEKSFATAARGYDTTQYSSKAALKIYLTGFDPFLLDRNLQQSNPSGVIALALDGRVIEHAGLTAEIQSVIVPVRFQDFDQGLIETLLAPIYQNNEVAMVVTVSMGRAHFDLERFPGKRRSANAPDNLNQMGGGTEQAPKIPYLKQALLDGPEFIEFALPVDTMLKASGAYQVNDNPSVSYWQNGEKFSGAIEQLDTLQNVIAISGSGGGYLSNEISYRSLNLRRKLNAKTYTGHVHVPRVQQYDVKTLNAILQQFELMLKLSLESINPSAKP